MEKKIRYTLGKNERLKSRKAIDILFKEGKAISMFPFKIIYRKDVCTSSSSTENSKLDTTNLQAAFSVSKRHFKKATDRNRIKRLMREAYRLQKNNLQDTLEQTNQQAVVFILYVGNEIPVYEVVKEKINSALKKLQKIIHEAPAANC